MTPYMRKHTPLVAHTTYTTTERTQLRLIECPTIQTPPGAHFGGKVSQKAESSVTTKPNAHERATKQPKWMKDFIIGLEDLLLF